MKKKKREIRSKEYVTLRFKELLNGKKSLYLDIYKKGKRSYEFLKLYLIPESTDADKQKNQETLEQAEITRVQRNLDVLLYKEPLSEEKEKEKDTILLLTEWIHIYSQRKLEKGQSDAFSKQIDKMSKHLILYRGMKAKLNEVDREFCMGFITYLKTSALSNATIAGYFRCLNCALNAAVRDSLIPMNPISLIPLDERIKQTDSTREYLTMDEIRKLMHAPCKHQNIKQAYLFSCLSGLRISDIRNLKWCNIELEREQWRAIILIKKTQRFLYLPLSKEAVKWLPRVKVKDTESHIFHLPDDAYINVLLKQWVAENGIKKHITFHTARHTYATLLLTLGVDIYTVSKLLGHTQVTTTQIYAKIIDSKKENAVNRIPTLSKD